MDVGVEAVQGAEPGVVDVAVDVVGEQRRRQREADHRTAIAPHTTRRPSAGAARQDAEVGDEATPHQGIGRARRDAQLTAPGFAAGGSAASPPAGPPPPEGAGGGSGGSGGGNGAGFCPTPGA